VLEAIVRQAAAAAAVAADTIKTYGVNLGQCLELLCLRALNTGHGVLLQAAAAAGPGSKEQLQLYGLLLSVLKWAGVMRQSSRVWQKPYVLRCQSQSQPAGAVMHHCAGNWPAAAKQLH
jgi:hypothetical protein